MRILLFAFVLLLASLCDKRTAWAYGSDSPKVVAMVDKGVKFLEGLSDKDLLKGSWGGEEYHSVIVGYAHFKARHDHDAPLVRAAVRQAQKTVAAVRQARGTGGPPGSKNKSVYEVSLCILLLCEVDAEKHEKEIEILRDALFSVQMSHGGFGYLGEPMGDTSQAQYVVLAMWTMDQKGIKVPETRVNGVHTWFQRVQDVGGAWPYRAQDPGPGKPLVRQGTKYMSMSTTLAGASSILIAGDYFLLWRERQRLNPIPEGVPEAVYVEGEKPLPGKERRNAARLKPEEILSSVRRMENYRKKEGDKKGAWPYYLTYALERFESFYEFAINQSPPEPPWYNKVVDDLASRQAANGGWGVKDAASSPPPVATAFAVLFLVRSTKQAIQESQQGTLAGGQGLPGSTVDIVVDGTSIKGKPVAGAVNDLLDMLTEGDGDALEGKSLPENMEIPTEPKSRKSTIDRLERLVRGSKSWQARRVAARLLAQSDEMRVVPSLIFALDDGDTEVRTFARDGLRFISRKFEGFGMEIKRGKKQDYGELRRAQRLWRQWFLTMDPGYVFVTN